MVAFLRPRAARQLASRWAKLGTTVVATLLVAGCSDPEPSEGEGSLDGVLRVNQLQAKATHNSYHIAPADPNLGAWQYTHAPMDEQLGAQGVRAFELDTQYNATDDRFECVHLPGLDEGTRCRVFTDCLVAMKSWSDQNPRHHLLFLQIEPKDVPPADDPEPYFARLEQEILSVWPRTSIVTPDDVRGPAATLREAVVSTGWPTLGATRGKLLLFVDNSSEFRAAYTRGGSDLNGRLMFIDSDVDSPFAGVLILNDPGAEVSDAVNLGFVVRTRADADVREPLAGETSRRDAALASGAQIVSTDFPVPTANIDYSVEIPGGTPSRCNPLVAPPACRSKHIENPSRLGSLETH
ncbi:MAG TPA: Ca2+-dependent phosphoinositide-specific phospholipase C [Polyangiaceae bacterium]|nr:Ca2+-dependent phosphoinositide-specific phospholipase C [Polyangiaceae bacterium]